MPSQINKLKEKGHLLLEKNKSAKKLYTELFINWHSKTSISKKCYPELYKAGRKKRYKQSTVQPIITKYFTVFRDHGWLETKIRKEKYNKVTYYRGTLKPYYEYLKIERGIELTYKEKKFIESFFKNIKNPAGYIIKSLDEESRKELFMFSKDFFKAMDKFMKELINRSLIYALNEEYCDTLFSSRIRKTNKKRSLLQPIQADQDSKLVIAAELATRFFDQGELRTFHDHIREHKRTQPKQLSPKVNEQIVAVLAKLSNALLHKNRD